VIVIGDVHREWDALAYTGATTIPFGGKRGDALRTADMVCSPQCPFGDYGCAHQGPAACDILALSRVHRCAGSASTCL
jgi:hypothetical protein